MNFTGGSILESRRRVLMTYASRANTKDLEILLTINTRFLDTYLITQTEIPELLNTFALKNLEPLSLTWNNNKDIGAIQLTDENSHILLKSAYMGRIIKTLNIPDNKFEKTPLENIPEILD